jgi:hypothetical protein
MIHDGLRGLRWVEAVGLASSRRAAS